MILMMAVFGLSMLTANAQEPAAGVPNTQAGQRVANISNVAYTLTFNVPATANENIYGTALITFKLKKKEDVTLDFTGKFSGACIVNKKKRALDMVNDHIIIPEKLLRAGENRVEMNFVSQSKAFLRGDDYVYTVLAPDKARSCFPCFDQPNLQALFTTKLNVPEGWKTLVSDSPRPMSINQYSFLVGKFQEKSGQREGNKIRALYRTNDAAKVEQIDKLFDEAGQSIHWMESYTGLKYPFQEFCMIILPDRQLSGMEHPGAVQLTERRMFLGKSPSQEEQLNRSELIAHETAHQWFGNMVTPKNSEEEWTKEVFTSFMASKITRRKLSRVDHDLNFIKTYQARALSIDRTEGTHPIAQPLDNLEHAGLLYDAVIYDKAPVVMRALEQLMSAPAMQNGLQKYLSTYYFKSASWDDLINILDAEAPTAGVRQFNEVWVMQKGMPVIHTTYKDGQLIVSQTDPFGRGLCWRQKFDVRVIYDMERSRTIPVDMQQPTVTIPLNQKPSSIIPNYNGRGYGRFTTDDEYTKKLPLRLITLHNDLPRYSLLLTLHDNYLMGRIPNSYFGELYRCMIKEKNPLIMETCVDHMFKIAFDMGANERKTLEQCIMDVLGENRSADCRQIIIRKMARNATSPEVLRQIENVWKQHNDPLFNEHDYMEMAYRLAITNPTRWQEILKTERQQLKTDDLRQEFDYVSRACNPDQSAQKKLFNDLLKAENRQQESWAVNAVRLLSADVREPQNNSYITTTLNNLTQLQKTSDVFFPGQLVKAVIASHKSNAAKQEIESFLKNDSKTPQNLKNKVLEAAWPLMKQEYYVETTPAKVVTNPKPAKKTTKKGTAKKTTKKK